MSHPENLSGWCSTFGWDEAINLCDNLINSIQTAASNSSSSKNKDVENSQENYHYGMYDYSQESIKKKTLEEALHDAYNQLFYIDQWGNTPLHAASYVKPPVDVIDALFRLGRAIVKYSPVNCREGCTPMWATTCKDGSTPFLVASSTGASIEVIHRYMDEIEYYIQQKWVIHPQPARMLVVQPDDQGTSPLQGFMSFHWVWIKRLLEQGTINNLNNQLNSLHILPRRNLREEEPSLDEYWTLVYRMLLFATMNIQPHTNQSSAVLVHRCAAISIYCPVSLLDWVVTPWQNGDKGTWTPGDTCAATLDSSGKLPLHWALEAIDTCSMFDEDIVHHSASFDSSSSDTIQTNRKISDGVTPADTQAITNTELICPREDAVIYTNTNLEQNRVLIVGKLLKWHPKAASTPFPNNGRSPLVQAIAHGGRWHGNYNGNDYLGLLQLLWTHAPEESLKQDGITSLYPFMLAATIQPNDDTHDCEIVDNVFNLLRKDPQLISGSTGS